MKSMENESDNRQTSGNGETAAWRRLAARRSQPLTSHRIFWRHKARAAALASREASQRWRGIAW